jgi:hypothetical protein
MSRKNYTGRIFFEDGEGQRVLLGSESGVNKKELRQKLLDNYWDSRLDSADCSPVYTFSRD